MIETHLSSDQLKTAEDPEVELCTEAGVGHDFRPNHHVSYGRNHVSWVCVWCHGVACGDYTQFDPCMEIHHHKTLHKARSGATWPIGGSRDHEAIH